MSRMIKSHLNIVFVAFRIIGYKLEQFDAKKHYDDLIKYVAKNPNVYLCTGLGEQSTLPIVVGLFANGDHQILNKCPLTYQRIGSIKHITKETELVSYHYDYNENDYVIQSVSDIMYEHNSSHWEFVTVESALLHLYK